MASKSCMVPQHQGSGHSHCTARGASLSLSISINIIIDSFTKRSQRSNSPGASLLRLHGGSILRTILVRKASVFSTMGVALCSDRALKGRTHQRMCDNLPGTACLHRRVSALAFTPRPGASREGTRPQRVLSHRAHEDSLMRWCSDRGGR